MLIPLICKICLQKRKERKKQNFQDDCIFKILFSICVTFCRFHQQFTEHFITYTHGKLRKMDSKKIKMKIMNCSKNFALIGFFFYLLKKL